MASGYCCCYKMAIRGISGMAAIVVFWSSVFKFINNYTSWRDCLSFFVFIFLFLIKKLVLVFNTAFVLES